VHSFLILYKKFILSNKLFLAECLYSLSLWFLYQFWDTFNSLFLCKLEYFSLSSSLLSLLDQPLGLPYLAFYQKKKSLIAHFLSGFLPPLLDILYPLYFKLIPFIMYLSHLLLCFSLHLLTLLSILGKSLSRMKIKLIAKLIMELSKRMKIHFEKKKKKKQ
jgi:hypothetical protein